MLMSLALRRDGLRLLHLSRPWLRRLSSGEPTLTTGLVLQELRASLEQKRV